MRKVTLVLMLICVLMSFNQDGTYLAEAKARYSGSKSKSSSSSKPKSKKYYKKTYIKVKRYSRGRYSSGIRYYRGRRAISYNSGNGSGVFIGGVVCCIVCFAVCFLFFIYGGRGSHDDDSYHSETHVEIVEEHHSD